MRSILSSLLLITSPLPAIPTTGTLTLSTAPGDNVLAVEITAGVGSLSASDTDSTTVTGSLEILGDISRQDSQVVSVQLTGGDLAFSDMNFNFQAGIVPITVQTATATDLAGIPSTPNPPSPVNADQTFDAALHVVTLNEGSVSSNGVAGSFNQNFSTNPLSVEGMGTGRVTLTEISRTLNSTNYNVRVELPVSATDPIVDETDTERGTITVSGTLVATGMVQVFEDKFTQWAVENEISDLETAPSFSADANNDGIANGLAWALGLGTEPLSTPLLSISGQTTTVALPGTTTSMITVQSSDDLNFGNIGDSMESIMPGSSGEIVLPASTESRRFYRLMAMPPSP